MIVLIPVILASMCTSRRICELLDKRHWLSLFFVIVIHLVYNYLKSWYELLLVKEQILRGIPYALGFHGKTGNLNPLSPMALSVQTLWSALSFSYENTLIFFIIAFAMQFFSSEEKSVLFSL